jgi:proton-dependent oligopeptide transporter, POT family
MAKDDSIFDQPQAATVARDEAPPGIQQYTDNRRFFGHPEGLSTLFFTEMWERFSYYGIRPLLILFMTAALTSGGFAYDRQTAAAIVGIYAACVYLAALPGGWIADRWLGLRRSIWYGGLFITAGHLAIALSAIFAQHVFFIGLILIVIGTGLLKPNISAIVGDLYPEGGGRRDAGFSIFYMGINIGALAAPLLTGYLGERVGWHYGFGIAGVGMLLGVIWYRIGAPKTLGPIGMEPSAGLEEQRRVRSIALAGLGVIAVIVLLASMGMIPINPVRVAESMTAVILSMALLYFAYVFLAGGLNTEEKKRIGVIVVLFLFAVVFWSAFEQAPTSLNLFARDFTDRVVFGWEMPTLWLQSANSFFVITLAPVFAMIWIALGKRGKDPSSPAKFAIGLFFAGLGFLIMVMAANRVIESGGALRVSPMWLVASYLMQTIGELSLSPVGLSSMTKLSPRKFVGQMMGVWFMAAALGNLIAGLVGGNVDPENLQQMPELFFRTAMSLFIATAVLGLLIVPIRRMMREAKH